jgi:hypothetical protein
MEQFANNCLTYVASGGYTAGSGVLNVDSTAAPWPQVGDFRISIFDQTTEVLKVILKVTAVTNATQFAVTAEGTDANAGAGDLVQGTMITAGVMKNIGWVLLESKTANNSASLTFTDIITSAYDEYMIEIIGLLPVSDNVTFTTRFSTDNGANYDSGANYTRSLHYFDGGVHDKYEGTTSTAAIDHDNQVNTAAYGGIDGYLRLFNPLYATRWTKIMGQLNFWHKSDGKFYTSQLVGIHNSAAAVNALEFKYSSGNIASGNISIRGIPK